MVYESIAQWFENYKKSIDNGVKRWYDIVRPWFEKMRQIVTSKECDPKGEEVMTQDQQDALEQATGIAQRDQICPIRGRNEQDVTMRF
ncbi:MAG TPA: hypothetical protein VKT82_25185 [Ktedonobacterales bacterium]|nr:hypothetical protein [Ktedonobacterales bacterium]